MNPKDTTGIDWRGGAEMTVAGDALVLRKPASAVRAGWAEAAQRIAESGDDELVMGEFGNTGDQEMNWRCAAKSVRPAE